MTRVTFCLLNMLREDSHLPGEAENSTTIFIVYVHTLYVSNQGDIQHFSSVVSSWRCRSFCNKAKQMWAKLTSRISDVAIASLLERTQDLIESNGKEAINWGKDFFTVDGTNPENIDLLKQIHCKIWPQISVNFSDPVIDHAALLIKSPGGAPTRLHQDSAYWSGRESTPSIFSVWIALEDMSKEKGGLMLLQQNEVEMSCMSTFNSGSTYEHEQVQDVTVSGGFPLLIVEPIASQLEKTMVLIELKRGESVAFDSYEPHMAATNTTNTPRLAMKVAYADGAATNRTHRYMMQTSILENY
jgi:hypothetical protein